MPNIVVIIGRPNVGKSTLFNRLVGRRMAIVHPMPGVTRDRIYGTGTWLGRQFEVVDTGGLISSDHSFILKKIRDQVGYALQEADAALLLVDGRNGLHPEDSEIAKMLYQTGIPFLIAVNKIDRHQDASRANEFFVLGKERVFPISAEHGLGVDDLLEELMVVMPESAPAPPPKDVLRLLILGRPNVGKSTLLNRIVKQERAIVDDQPGTTRDLLTIFFTHQDQTFMITDTAGLRKKARVKAPVELYSVLRAIHHIDRCDIALLLIDAPELVTNQDKRIAHLVLAKNKGLLIAVNKIDLVSRTQQSPIGARIVRDAPYLRGIPVLLISALKGFKIHDLLMRVISVFQERQKWVDKPTLEALVPRLRLPGGKNRVLSLHQTGIAPPAFLAVVTGRVVDEYVRYLEHELRNYFGLDGNPVVIKWRIARAR